MPLTREYTNGLSCCSIVLSYEYYYYSHTLFSCTWILYSLLARTLENNNRILSLRALDNHVISDEEIIENVKLSESFQSLTRHFNLQLYISPLKVFYIFNLYLLNLNIILFLYRE